jgi:hypothetical protein
MARQTPACWPRIEELESQLARIPADQDEVVARPPALHPGLAETYRRKVAGLQSALAKGGDQETLEAVRALIDRVIISPPETDGDPPGLELIGELMAMLATAGATPHTARSGARQGANSLALFVSSVKEDPGGKTLALGASYRGSRVANRRAISHPTRHEAGAPGSINSHPSGWPLTIRSSPSPSIMPPTSPPVTPAETPSQMMSDRSIMLPPIRDRPGL